MILCMSLRIKNIFCKKFYNGSCALTFFLTLQCQLSESSSGLIVYTLIQLLMVFIYNSVCQLFFEKKLYSFQLWFGVIKELNWIPRFSDTVISVCNLWNISVMM